ncbi:MAG: very short patch repair endonuclease [Mycobacteriales bacterium]
MPGPTLSSDVVRRRMQQQRRRDTRPEIALRRALHAAGLRYRVEVVVIPGVRRRADVVFGPAKVAVFVDGCFWHVCPQHATSPKSNADWWREKLDGNRKRDRDTDRRLLDQGWLPVRVWEHEDSAEAALRVVEVVRRRRESTENLGARCI